MASANSRMAVCRLRCQLYAIDYRGIIALVAANVVVIIRELRLRHITLH